MTTGKTIALTRQTFVDKVMSLLLNMLSRLVTTFLPRSKRLLISRLQLPSADFGAQKNKVSHCFHCFPTSFPIKWWDRMPWSSFSECWALSQLFHSPLSLSSRGSLVFFFTFCHQGGVICVSEVIDLSPGNLDFSLCFLQPSIYKDRPKKQVGCLDRQGRINNPGSWQTGLVVGVTTPADLCIHQQNFKVETEACSGFSHVGSSAGLNDTFLSQGQTYAPEMAPSLRMVGRKYIPRAGEGSGASDCPGPDWGSTSHPSLSVTSSNNILQKWRSVLDNSNDNNRVYNTSSHII